MKAKKKHIEWIDLLRCLAICCVVLTHVSQRLYPVEMSHMEAASFGGKMAAYIMISIGRFGVPLFLMISGYLLLDREYDGKRCKRFWKHNLLGLILTTEIWVVIYSIFAWRMSGNPITAEYLIESMLFVRYVDPGYAGPLWYMPMLFGLYLFVPFLANILRKIDLKLLRIPATIAVLYLFAVPVINVILQTWGLDPIASRLSLEFSGGIYGVFLIFGFFFNKGFLDRVKSRWFVIVALISGALLILTLYEAFKHQYDYQIWYDDIFLLICSVCIFKWFSRIKKIWWKPLVKSLAKCSFGIYLFHNIFVVLVIRHMEAASVKIMLPFTWAVSIAVSWLLVWLLSRNKTLGKLLFFMK